jgi:hypothetical protein
VPDTLALEKANGLIAGETGGDVDFMDSYRTPGLLQIDSGVKENK